MTNRFTALIKHFDWVLLAAVLLLIGISLMELYSIALSRGGDDLVNFQKQLVFVGVGIILVFALSAIDFHTLRSLSNYLYLGGIILLAGVLIFGVDIRGTRGWYNIFGLSLQPVEFAKVILLIFLARYFSGNTVRIAPVRHLAWSGIGAALFIGLVLWQPDFGSASILFLLWAGMLLVSGFKRRYLAIIAAFLAIALLAGWLFFFQPYQKERIATFLNPAAHSLEQSYNVTQAKIAVGAGRLLGRGVGFGSQSQLKFLPEAQNDFIFAVIAEELGFVGITVVFTLFGIVFYRLLRPIRNFENDFARYCLIATALLLFIQLFINIGMNIGLLPVIGISLPLLSSGGSAVIATFILIGIAESIIIRSDMKYDS